MAKKNLIKANRISIEKIQETSEIIHPFDPSKIDIILRPMSLDLLIKRMSMDEINVTTPFQRKEGLWDPGKQSRLIESLLIRIPLQAFYFDGTDDSQWLIVDGLQRLTSLKNFIVDKSLKLTGLEYLQEYNNYTFDQLPRSMQRRIEETQITAYIINPGTPPEVKYNIFKRINTGGLVLEAQEIRNALYQGIAADLLSELAGMQVFKDATCGAIESKRMEDREFILRFIAFLLTPYSAYSGDMDTFLTQTVEKLKTSTPRTRREIQAKFDQAMSVARRIFGDDAFRKRYDYEHRRSPVNKALFESWAVNLAQLTNQEVQQLTAREEQVKAQFMKLMHDQDFDKSISANTSHIKSVKIRFKSIENLIRKVLR